MLLAALLYAIAASTCAGGAMMPTQTPQPFRSLKEIRERGVVMQQWETSGAAAEVATVLTYRFNDPVSERLAAYRMLAQTDPAKVKQRGGFSLLDLKRFVEDRGYQGNAYQHLGFDDLRVFHAPIVPINQHGYNHYVVFNGIKDNQVLLADPAFGNRTLSIAGFTAIWMKGLAFVGTRPPSPRTRHEEERHARPAGLLRDARARARVCPNAARCRGSAGAGHWTHD